ncbi:MAG TPA: hypothetical protein QGF02_00750 [Candidatus Babeliales bacterium]|nr:hypothetical protein [Candidatus Babeliales bacterium]
MKKILTLFIVGCSLIKVAVGNDVAQVGFIAGVVPLTAPVLRKLANRIFIEKEKNPTAEVFRREAPQFLKGYGASSVVYLPFYAAGVKAAYTRKRKKLAYAIGALGVVDMSTRIAAMVYFHNFSQRK